VAVSTGIIVVGLLIVWRSFCQLGVWVLL
jgi:hypothetical protein